MKFNTFIIASFVAIATLFPAASKAQYYEMVSGLRSALSPALSGSGSYKGYVDAGYARTLGNYRGDFVGISTTQGYQYNSWFFMGAGLGVDVLFAHKNEGWGNGAQTPPNASLGESPISTAVMLPLFTDFRFSINTKENVKAASFYVDLKVGCSFLLSNKYIAIGDGYLTNQEYFFLQPSIGVRIPVNVNKPKQAFDIGIDYKLLTSNYWYRYNNNITLQALGAHLAFEW